MPPFVTGKIDRTFVDQGDKTTIVVKLDQKTPFDGKAKITLMGLPNKVTAAEKEFTKDDTEVQFDVQAEKTSPAGRHSGLFCQVTVMQNGEPIVQNIASGGVLRIDPATVAKADIKGRRQMNFRAIRCSSSDSLHDLPFLPSRLSHSCPAVAPLLWPAASQASSRKPRPPLRPRSTPRKDPPRWTFFPAT